MVVLQKIEIVLKLLNKNARGGGLGLGTTWFVLLANTWHRHCSAACSSYSVRPSPRTLTASHCMDAPPPASLMCCGLCLADCGVLYTTTTFISNWQLTLDMFNFGQLVACYCPVSVRPFSFSSIMYYGTGTVSKYSNSNNAIQDRLIDENPVGSSSTGHQIHVG